MPVQTFIRSIRFLISSRSLHLAALFFVSVIYSSSTALSSFGNQNVTSSFGTISFSPTGTVSLSAGTKYWLTIGTLMSAPNGLIVGANGPSLLPNGPYASFDSNNGIRSGLANDQSTDVSGFVSTPTFAIHGSIAAVPEPTSIALVGFACSLVALRLRRKTRK